MKRSKLTTKQTKLLQTVAVHRVLTAAQLSCLYGLSEEGARRSLKKLRKLGCLQMLAGPMGATSGRTPYVFALNAAGIQILRNSGFVERTVADDRLGPVAPRMMAHQLLQNWCQISHARLISGCDDLGGDFLPSTSPLLAGDEDGPWIAAQASVAGRVRHFVPDAVMGIASQQQDKHLLFFLEIDMGSESATSASSKANNLRAKILNYQAYQTSHGYRRYQDEWGCQLHGFRVLFVAAHREGADRIRRLAQQLPDTDFAWITHQDQMLDEGIGGNIWTHGTTPDPESILGPSLSKLLGHEGRL